MVKRIFNGVTVKLTKYYKKKTHTHTIKIMIQQILIIKALLNDGG